MSIDNTFKFLLIYYWALQYAFFMNEQGEPTRIMYYLYVAPISFFSVSTLILALLRVRVRLDVFFILCFLILGVAIALFRGDFNTVMHITLTSATIACVLGGNLKLSVDLINNLFLLSVVANAIAFSFGGSVYFVLPGFSIDEDLWWRVSIFPGVASSAFYSLLVLAVNLIRKDGAHRNLCIIVALYFFMLSGVRSALISAFIISGYWALRRKSLMNFAYLQVAYLVCSITLFVATLFSTQVIGWLSGFGGDFIGTYFFRSAVGLNTDDEVSKSIYRTWLWQEHFRIASINPIFGVGTFDFTAIADYNPILGEGGTGSESYITALYARTGVISIFLLIGIVMAMIRKSAQISNGLPFMTGLMILVAMLAYGSFIAPYDFLFLILLSGLNGFSRPSRK